MKAVRKKIILSIFMLATSAASQAAVIDFNNLSNADNVTSVSYNVGTQTFFADVSATGGIGEAWVFDTSNMTNSDGDLQNNDMSFQSMTDSSITGYDPGNLLVIQENQSQSGKVDDNAAGGTLTFEFHTAVNLSSIDLFDASQENVVIDLYREGETTAFASFTNFFNADTQDGGVNKFGTLDFVNATNVSTMVINLNGVSGAIDNIVISPVPEPSTYALMFAGLGVVGFMVKRKAKA